jgi:peptidoglycan hydrolase-like protein with peptidoglycan-binding domain
MFGKIEQKNLGANALEATLDETSTVKLETGTTVEPIKTPTAEVETSTPTLVPVPTPIVKTPTPTLAPTAEIVNTNLRAGSSGKAVTALQLNLIKLGYLAEGNATGYFGRLTDAALRSFQTASGLSTTGEYNEKTAAALKLALEKLAITGGIKPIKENPILPILPAEPETKGGQVLFIGGAHYVNSTSQQTNFNDVFVTSDMQTWTTASAQGISSNKFNPRNSVQAVYFAGKYWVLGGRYDAGILNGANDVWSSADGVNWSKAQTPPFASYVGYSAIVHGGKLYVIGGRTAADTTAHVWVTTDGNNWQTLTNAPTPATGLATVSYNGKLYILGGESNATGGSPEIWSTVDGSSWTKVLANAPWGIRSYATALVYNSKVYLMAGQVKNPSTGMTGTVSDVWTSTDMTNWTKLSQSGGPTGGATNDVIVAYGKMWWADNTTTLSSQAKLYSSTDGYTWTPTGKTLQWWPRTFHKMVLGTVSTPPVCVVNSFIAAPVTIQSGQIATLTWSTTGCNSVTINGIPQALSGSMLTGSLTSSMAYGILGIGTSSSSGANAYVTVLGAACNAGDKPWIRVATPNGAETYKAGDKVEVKWTSCNLPKNTLITAQLDNYTVNAGYGPLVPTTIAPTTSLALNNATVNDGQEVFRFPGSTAYVGNLYSLFGKHFNIVLTAHYPTSGATWDRSDDTFTITK